MHFMYAKIIKNAASSFKASSKIMLKNVIDVACVPDTAVSCSVIRILELTEKGLSQGQEMGGLCLKNPKNFPKVVQKPQESEGGHGTVAANFEVRSFALVSPDIPKVYHNKTVVILFLFYKGGRSRH